MRIAVVFILLVMSLSMLIVFAEPFTDNWEVKNIDLYAYWYYFPNFDGYYYCSVITNTSVLFVYFNFDYSFETLYVNANIINMSSNLAFQYFKTVRFDTGIEFDETYYVFPPNGCHVYDDSKLVFLINIEVSDQYFENIRFYIGVYEIDLKTFNISKSTVIDVGFSIIANVIFTDNFIVVGLFRGFIYKDRMIILNRHDFTIKAQYSVDYETLANLLQKEGYSLAFIQTLINSVIELNNTLYIFTGIYLQYYNYNEYIIQHFIAVIVNKLENGTVQTSPSILYISETPFPLYFNVLAVFNNRYNRWLITISLYTGGGVSFNNYGFGEYASAGEGEYFLIFIDADLNWYNYTDKLIIYDNYKEYYYQAVFFYCDSVFIIHSDGYFIYNSFLPYIYVSTTNYNQIPYYPSDGVIYSYFTWVVKDRVYGIIHFFDSDYNYNGTMFFTDSLGGFKLMPSEDITYLVPSVLNSFSYSTINYELKSVDIVENVFTNTVSNVEVFQVNEGFTFELYDHKVVDSPCCKVVNAGGGQTTTKPTSLYFSIDIISNLKRFQLLLLLLYVLFFIPILKAYGVSRALAISSAICSSLSLLVGAYEFFSFFVITMIIGFALWQSGY